MQHAIRKEVRRPVGTIVLALIAAFALTLGTALPAAAATRSGSRQCTGAKLPQIFLNTSGGSGTWTNYTSPSSSTPMTFTSGIVLKYAPYQQTYWYVVANSFFEEPWTTCN